MGVVAPHVAGLDTFVIQSPPDLAALFALGVLSAGIVAASQARRSWPWGWLSLGAAAPVVGMVVFQGSVWTLDHIFWVDLALGPAIACLLAALATGQPKPVLRLLDALPATILFARAFASVFEAPFLTRRSGSTVPARPRPRIEGVLG